MEDGDGGTQAAQDRAGGHSMLGYESPADLEKKHAA